MTMLESSIGGPADLPNGLFVGGDWTVGAGVEIEVENPATRETVGWIRGADAAQLDRAVSAAAKVFQSEDFQDAERRAAALERLADLLEAERESIGALIVDEAGTPVNLIDPLQVGVPLRLLRYYAGLARRNFTRDLGPDSAETGASASIVRYAPAGVVGIIAAYNYPLLLLVLKLAPAIAAGCPVVCMPSPLTPLSSLVFARLVDRCGLPKGAVSILAGDSDIARALTEHPGIDRISFTGSVAVGKLVMKQAAEQLKDVTLELGGKSAAILLPGCDLGAVTAPVHLRYLRNAGQGCASPTRILVHRSQYDAFIERTRAFVPGVPIGDPRDPDTVIGPLISEAHRNRVEGFVERAVAAGARVVAGGGRPDTGSGWYMNGTVVDGIDNDSEIAREELFGPVGVILPYDDLDEAVAIANDSHLGLAAAIFGDLDTARSIATRLRVGSVYINGGGGIRMEAPMGGMKQSGIGREYGEEGLFEFMEPQHIQWAL